MNSDLLQSIPKLKNLPRNLPTDEAVRLDLEQGILIFRASPKVQNRIAQLLDKEKDNSITAEERRELAEYEEIDDYLSHVNRLIRNSAENSEANIAA